MSSFNEENAFAELYKTDIVKVTYLVCHFLLTFFGPGLLYSVIWFVLINIFNVEKKPQYLITY